jgi:hypothetical protein
MKKNYWLKTAAGGKPSASLTLVMVTYTVVMLWLLLSIFVNPFGLTIAPFNASEAMLVLSPILMLYFGRRQTDVKEQEAQNKQAAQVVQQNNVNVGEAD